MRPHYVLGSFKYWCTLSFSFLWELCSKNIIIYISFRWRNNLSEVRKFAWSHTTRMWGNGSFWLQSSYFSPFPTSPLLQQSPWIANATCHCLHHCLWALEGIWWLWFQDCDPTAQYRVCSQVPSSRSELFHLQKPGLESKSSKFVQSLQMGQAHYLLWKGDKGAGLASLRTCRCFLRPWEHFCFLPVHVAAGKAGSMVLLVGMSTATSSQPSGNCPEVWRPGEAPRGWRPHRHFGGFLLKPRRSFVVERAGPGNADLQLCSLF